MGGLSFAPDGLALRQAASPFGPAVSRASRAGWDNDGMRDLVNFLRANPQVLALLVICLVLGLGTFLAVMFGLISAGSTTTNGEPTGLIAQQFLG